jgi:hypothetical protein
MNSFYLVKNDITQTFLCWLISLVADGTRSKERRTLGKMDDLLENVHSSEGNTLGTMQLPAPLLDRQPPPKVASDRHAWISTIGRLYCKRQQSPPFSHTTWAAAATAHFLTPWLLGPEGSCTYIDALVGSIWVVVARPRKGDQYQLFGTHLYGDGFDPFSANAHLWDMDGVVLGAGSRM